MFISPTAPMAHQKEAVKRALRHPLGFGHMAETGTGKSGMVLLEWQHRLNLGNVRDLLVVAPAGSINNWYRDKTDEQLAELKVFLDPNLLKELLVANNRGKAADVYARKELFKYPKQPRALFVNVEAFSRGRDTDAEIMCRKFLMEGNAMMVIDESTAIRRKSKRTLAVHRLGRLAKARRILSGLMTPKSPLDLYYQMNFLDERILNFSSYVAFRARYARVHLINAPPEGIIDLNLKRMCARKRMKVPDTSDWTVNQKIHFVLDNGGWCGGGAPVINGFQNLEELRSLYLPYVYQVYKKDCLDLKPKVYEPRELEMTAEQKRIYKQIKEEAMAKLDDGSYVSALNVLGQMVRLHQIVCGHVVTEDGQIKDIDSHRIDAIMEILEEHDGKVIIWVMYDHELRKLANALRIAYGPKSVACFWGGNRNTRHEDEKRFLGDPQCTYMLSTPPSGGRGNTWNVANLTIYAANSYDLEHRIQSEDRNHRKGQKDKVTYIDLIVPGTVEQKIIQALRRKLDLTQVITGSNYREWLI